MRKRVIGLFSIFFLVVFMLSFVSSATISGCDYLSRNNKQQILNHPETIITEGASIGYQDYFMLPISEEESKRFKLTQVNNHTIEGQDYDYVKFVDISTNEVYETIWMGEGTGIVYIAGNSYDIMLHGNSGIPNEGYNVTIDFWTTSGDDKMTFEGCPPMEIICTIKMKLTMEPWDFGPVVLLGGMIEEMEDTPGTETYEICTEHMYYGINISSNVNKENYDGLEIGQRIRVLLNYTVSSEFLSYEILPDEPACTDSDGGKNYYVEGVNTGISKTGEIIPPSDYCLSDATTLAEGFCDSEEYVDFISYTCPYGCESGICLTEYLECEEDFDCPPPRTCIDDVCKLKESAECQDNTDCPEMYQCFADVGKCLPVECVKDSDCEEGELCLTGICEDVTKKECTDSDGGKNFFTKGKTCVGDDCKEDYCANDDTGEYVNEWFCDEEEKRKFIGTLCTQGCQNGACLEKEVPLDGCYYLSESNKNHISNLSADSEINIILKEGEKIHYKDYFVVPISEGNSKIFKLISIKNSTTGYNNDYVKFLDIITEEVYETIFVGEGIGILSAGGYSHEIRLHGNSILASESDNLYIAIDYSDKFSASDWILSFENCPIKSTPIEKGYKYASWQCHNGESERQGSIITCKTENDWKNDAREFCQKQCDGNNKKCEVNTFSLLEECNIIEPYPLEEMCDKTGGTWKTFEDTCADFCEVVRGEADVNCGEALRDSCDCGSDMCWTGGNCEANNINQIPTCTDSCARNGKCYPFGYRKSGDFCSEEGLFIEQQNKWSVCENHFECNSNICVEGECISKGVMQAIMDFIERLFGNSYNNADDVVEAQS